MRCGLSIACLSILLAAVLTPAAGEGGVITIQWSGPSQFRWAAAEKDFMSGGDGFIRDTSAYQGCRWGGDLFTFCHGFWNQGLGAGGSDPPPELDPLSGRGFGLNVYQSMPDFEISPSCQPRKFKPCYTQFTPLQLDWRYEGEGGSPFVWLSSKGGVLAVRPDWDGGFHGSEWEDIQWMRGVYGCLYFGHDWNGQSIFCPDTLDPFIYGMTIQIAAPAPEPATLALMCAGLAGALARARRRNGAQRAESDSV